MNLLATSSTLIPVSGCSFSSPKRTEHVTPTKSGTSVSVSSTTACEGPGCSHSRAAVVRVGIAGRAGGRDWEEGRCVEKEPGCGLYRPLVHTAKIFVMSFALE